MQCGMRLAYPDQAGWQRPPIERAQRSAHDFAKQYSYTKHTKLCILCWVLLAAAICIQTGQSCSNASCVECSTFTTDDSTTERRDSVGLVRTWVLGFAVCPKIQFPAVSSSASSLIANIHPIAFVCGMDLVTPKRLPTRVRLIPYE